GMDPALRLRCFGDGALEKIRLGLDGVHPGALVVIAEHRPGAAADFEHAAREIAHELAPHFGVALRVGSIVENVEKLRPRVLLLASEHLRTMAHEVGNPPDHIFVSPFGLTTATSRSPWASSWSYVITDIPLSRRFNPCRARSFSWGHASE